MGVGAEGFLFLRGNTSLSVFPLLERVGVVGSPTAPILFFPSLGGERCLLW